MSAATLTLADAARMMREAVKDRSYVDHTGLGYEYCLAAFAIHYADLSLEDFDGKHGTNLIRDFLRHQYAEVQGNTWNTRLATLKAMFKWAFEERRIDHNPAAVIRYRTVPESERQAHAPSVIERIFGRKPNLCAVQDLSPRPPERVATRSACNTQPSQSLWALKASVGQCPLSHVSSRGSL